MTSLNNTIESWRTIPAWENLEDLYKAKHVLEKYIEVNANENQ